MMNIFGKILGVFTHLAREMRWSYLPPLMVYCAYGISGLTAIVGTFFVKDYLGLSAAFLASLTFWAGIPWALKMPLGHIVDLIWRWKSILVYLGASLLAASVGIMIGLLGHTETMLEYASAEAWYVLAALLAPVGYVLQDVVADGMTIDAVPTTDETGKPHSPERLKAMHTTMQMLGRMALVGGGVFVALLNMYLFDGVDPTDVSVVQPIYLFIYQLALIIPVVSILGVFFAFGFKVKRRKSMLKAGVSEAEIRAILDPKSDIKTSPDWKILIGSAIYVTFTIFMGLSDIPYAQEIIFVGSMAIVIFLIRDLMQHLSETARVSLVATAVLIFVFRALPTTGAGASWWQIDVLGFDQSFLALLSLIGSSLALIGMLWLRSWMAEKSIPYIIGFLTIAGTLLSLPIVGMYYGLHEWTSALTGGVVDARFIAVFDTALESPLGQVAMIPMLAWIANSAPIHLKATFFAVMASFTNLALSASSLATKYLNQIFTVTREVTENGVVTVPEDYSELGVLMITATVIGFTAPMLMILLLRNKVK
jgi:hypothetical protein